MRPSFRKPPPGMRLYLLAALAAAFLLVPAASAMAAHVPVHIIFEGEGSGAVTGNAFAPGEPEEVDCSWDGSAKSGVCDTESSTVEGSETLKVDGEAASGSEFVGWEVESGFVLAPLFCHEIPEAPGLGGCTVRSLVGEEIVIKAVFASTGPPSFKLNLNSTGSGSGTFMCKVEGGSEEACEAEYEESTEIEVIDHPDTGSHFVEWEGDCSGTGACTVEMTAEKTVMARNDLDEEAFSVGEPGSGSGTVQCEDNGFPLAGCEGPVLYGHTVKVTATPDAGSTLGELEGTGSAAGECSFTATSGSCEFTIEEASAVDAEFNLESKALTIAEPGSGTGTVQCEVDGGGLEGCPTNALYGSTIKVLASADGGSELASISGTGSASGCSASGCEFTLTADSEVTVDFKLESEDAFSVTKIGSGTGTVQCEVDGGGLEPCGSAPHGSTIKLVASPATGSELASVSGTGSASTCTASPCEFTLEEASSATVEFKLESEALGVNKSGEGTVQCEVNGGGLGTCPTSADYGSTIKLVASPATGSELASVSGTGSASGCSASPCEFTITEGSEVTVEFALESKALTIAEPGSGTGTVECEVDGGGLEGCPTTALYGSTIRVLASADSGSELASVSGAGSASACTASPCEFTLEADSEVSVEFNLENSSLTIGEMGTGSGTVGCEDNGGGLEPCAGSYANGDTIKVVASPDTGSELGMISGTGSASGCTASPCEFTLEADSEVTVEFKLKRSLTTEESGTGSGSFECDAGSGPGPCAAGYLLGTEVTVIAVPAASSDFTSWSGECDSTNANECIVTLDADKTVEAVFTLKNLALSVAKAGTGTGAVSSEPAGIACGGACSHSYDYGTTVTLSASPGPISDFAGWSGCDEALGESCKVRLSAARTVTASFTQRTKALTVKTVGPGSGSVSCDGGPCASSYPEGATVALHANPDSDSSFFGWAGAGCTGGGDCVVTLNRDITVAAAFEANPPAPPAAGGGQGKRSPCAGPARRAKKLSGHAKRLRRNARKLARNGHRGKARRLRGKANRYAKRAHRLSRTAKRCRARRSRGTP